MRSDQELLRAYLSSGEGAAFEALVGRHGANVYRACLRYLKSPQDAEDACQAVFLVLLRRIRSAARTRSLAAWLMSVARNVSMTAIRTRASRAKREEEAAVVRTSDKSEGGAGSVAGGSIPVLGTRLDEALQGLPKKQAEAVVLRYLQGHSQKQAAVLAGCPVGTLSRRASQGLERLRRRLAGRGVSLGSAALLAALESEAGTAVPATLVPRLLEVPALSAGLAAGSSPGGNVPLLVKGAMKAMFMTKLKIVTAVFCAVTAVSAGTPFVYRALAAGAAAKAGNGKEPVKNDTALGRLAASLKPGEMKELKTKGYNGNLVNSWYPWDHKNGKRVYGAQRMFNIMTDGWANDGKWDPKTRQVFYLGTGHYAALKFVSYSDDSNSWTLMPVPTWADPRNPKAVACGKERGKRVWPRSHTYDCQFIDPESRLFGIVWRPWIYTYNIDTRKWSWVKSQSANAKNCDIAAEYFPEMKGLLFTGYGGNLVFRDLAAGKERRLGRAGTGAHGVMEYNPVHKVLVWGGLGRLWRLEAGGKPKKLKAPPGMIACVGKAKFMCDPVSGEFVVQTEKTENSKRTKKAPSKTYAYHPIKDEWKELPDRRFPSGVAVPVSTYGVIMICSRNKVYVYKHKPVWPDALPGKGEAK